MHASFDDTHNPQRILAFLCLKLSSLTLPSASGPFFEQSMHMQHHVFLAFLPGLGHVQGCESTVDGSLYD